MEDTLLLQSDNMKEDGRDITEDEDMTPCINSPVVMDWVDAIGGAPLVEHVHRIYAKDLETVTLGSLQSRIYLRIWTLSSMKLRSNTSSKPLTSTGSSIL